MYKGLLLTFVLLLLCSTTFSQLAVDNDNSCREGTFTHGVEDFSVAWVKAKKRSRVYLYSDKTKNCPAGASCRMQASLVSDDMVITGRERGKFTCSWYTPDDGSPKVGWLRTTDLNMPAAISDASEKAWAGDWSYGKNAISILPGKSDGVLKVSGIAFWLGLGDNIHTGKIDGQAPYKNGVMNYSEGDGKSDCRVKFELLWGYLIASDNMKCGGANVTFSGVYYRVGE